MTVGLERFQQAAQVSRTHVTLDTQHDGQLNVHGGSLGGRAVAWIRDKVTSDATLKAENRAVTQEFVAALKERYGDRLGGMADNLLAGDLAAGKRLTARTINQVTQAVQAEADRIRSTNTSLINNLAHENGQGGGATFGQLVADVGTALGSTKNLAQLDPELVTEARAKIERELTQLSRDPAGKTVEIDPLEAQAVAQKVVTALFVQDARNAAIAEFLTPGPGSAFDTMFQAGLDQRGIGLAQADFDLSSLLRNAKATLVGATYNPNEQAHTRPLDRDEAQRLVQGEVDKLLNKLAPSFAKATALANGDQAVEALLAKATAAMPKMTPVLLERMHATVPLAATLYDRLADGHASLESQVGALKDLAARISRDLGELGIGGEDANVYLRTMFDLTTQIGGHDVPKNTAIADTLGKPEFGALRDTLTLPLFDPEAMESLGDAGKALIGMSTLMGPLRDAITQDPEPDQDRARLESFEDVPHGIVAALQANGLKTLPPLGVDRSGTGAFGPDAVATMKQNMVMANEPLLKDAPNAQVDTPLTGAMVRDFGRSTHIVGDQVVSTVGSTDKGAAIAAFTAFATGEDGRVDENMLWALSQVAHQGSFADMLMMAKDNLGPFRGVPDGQNENARATFAVSRNEAGDVTIQASYVQQPVEGLTDFATGERTPLGEGSAVSLKFEVTLRKADYDQRVLNPVMASPPSYSFDFARA